MATDEALVVIASHLRSEEAGMLRGLLESAGIFAVLRDDALSSIHPFLQPVIGGAKLAVLERDVERAIRIVSSAGVIPSQPQDETVEIPEEEWSQGTSSPPASETPSSTRQGWPRRIILAVLTLIALFFTICGLR